MAKYISNRNGGKTDEQGHYRFHVNAWDGNILNDGLKVKQNSPLGMSVLIEPGDVKIDYSTYGYTGWNDADEAVTIATADGSNPRIDRIVAYVDRGMTPNPSNSNNPGMLKFMSVAGTPAGSPSPVSDSTVNTAVSSNPWCELARVQVNSGVSTITNGSITDKRTFATLANVTPVGSVLDFAGTSAPTGWLLCYGQALDATATPAYQDLFDVIGNTFGGTNNTNFVVPDLRGRVVAGQDDMGGSSANRLTNPGTTTGGIDGDGLGNTGGSETHALTSAQNGTHTHNGLLMDENPSFEIGITGLGGSDSFQRNVAGGISTSGYNIGTKSSGSGSGHNNVQPTIILNKIIKY